MSEWMQTIKDSLYINLVYEDRYMFLIKGFLLTLCMTGLTFLLATILGAVFCRIRLGKIRTARKIVELVSTLFIRLPTLVLLLIFVYLLFSGWNVDTVFLAIIAFTMKAGAYISDILFTAYRAIRSGEIEAGRTLGLSRWKVFRYVILPQVVQKGLPTYKNQLIITLQETSLVGFFAINDLTRASQVITSRTMDPYISLIITSVAYLLIGALSSLLFRLVDRQKHLKAGEDYSLEKSIPGKKKA